MNWRWVTMTRGGKLNQIHLSSIRRHYQQVNDEALQRVVEVRAEMLKRNFTKRQLNILNIIYEFSYPFGKDKAMIPRLQDFELCGIGKTKIREELDKLIDLNVIGEEQNFGLYWFNNPDIWKVNRHKNYSDKRYEDLIVLNLRDGNASVEVEDIIKNKTE